MPLWSMTALWFDCPHDASFMHARYRAVRAQTESLCAPLAIEDYVIQSMEDASPARWHLAHTTWFFETFVLAPHLADYRPIEPRYKYLFNSYYQGVGAQFPRPHRGTLSRPTVKEVYAWRRAVDEGVEAVLNGPKAQQVLGLIEVGLHHEQQHQELLVTDVKHGLLMNPMEPVYHSEAALVVGHQAPQGVLRFEGGMVEIGHCTPGFCYDNEGPAHRVFLQPFGLHQNLVTQGEYLAFMADDGYQRADLWLSDGWYTVQAQGWRSPLYWEQEEGEWSVRTLGGRRALNPDAPVAHLSFFEADAYARWANKRLPTEFEWEHAARHTKATPSGSFLGDGRLHPVGAESPEDAGPLRHLLGEVWEWTSSPYVAYPRYSAPSGALGEYNGKFMNAQRVLRGGSCATAKDHIRSTYRNFFPADKRWQFSGLRLAEDVES